MSAVRNQDGIFINTEVFREEAKYFEKHGHYPCGEPNDDPYSEYHQYWAEQNKRCIEGYSVGGVRITGDHYDYLNFKQIRLKENVGVEEALTKKYYRRAVKKRIFFPDFWDGDYDYFHVLDIAEKGVPSIYGIDYNDPKIEDKVLKAYNSIGLSVKIHPDDLGGGYHVVVAKARRKGFSFKNASVLVNRYKRVPNFTGVLAAYEMKYITPMGTMDMASDYIDFVNQYTGWTRIKSIDRILHQKDAYEEIINGVKIEKGYKSQIIGLTCKDNPGAIRGKDPDMALLEEGGTWPGSSLSDTIAATLPSLGAGIYTTGIMIIFGTGSADAEDWGDFERLFYSPQSDGFIRIENQWDTGAEGTFCSFYFPDRKNKEGFYDVQGNSDEEGAIEWEKRYRERLSESGDAKKLQLRSIEYANSPQETFATVSINNFPVEELKIQRSYVLSRMSNFAVKGKLSGSIGGDVNFYPDNKLVAIDRYPWKDTSNIRGCVVQYFSPFRIGNKVPDNLYIICHDPFATEGIDGSLGVAYVIMNPNNIVPGFKDGNIIVASYIGRDSLDEYNRTLFLMATYYNAKIGFENDRGDIVGFAKRNRECFKYLESEFELGWRDDINNKLNRGYGMSMSGGKKDLKRSLGNVFIKEWLLEPRGITEDGEQLRTLNFIYDIGLLDELIKFGKGNFDRVSALRIGMYHQKELIYNKIETSVSSNNSVNKFFKTKLAS